MQLAERIVSPVELEEITRKARAVICYGSKRAVPHFTWSFEYLETSEDGGLTAYNASGDSSIENSLTITGIQLIRLLAHPEPIRGAAALIYNADGITALRLNCLEPVKWFSLLAI